MSWCYPGRILRLWETYAVTSSDCEGPGLPNIILVIITRQRGRSYINLLSISQYCKLTVAPLVTSLANLKIQSSWQMLCGLESSSRLSRLKRLNEEAWRRQENISSVLTSLLFCQQRERCLSPGDVASVNKIRARQFPPASGLFICDQRESPDNHTCHVCGHSGVAESGVRAPPLPSSFMKEHKQIRQNVYVILIFYNNKSG